MKKPRTPEFCSKIFPSSTGGATNGQEIPYQIAIAASPQAQPQPNIFPKPNQIPTAPSSSRKIPFRPRKIRKLSSKSTPSNQISTPNSIKSITDTFAIPGKVISSQPSSSSLNTVKPLSYTGEISTALQHLRSSEPLLEPLIDSYQIPTFKSSNPPFLALTRSILYQQLATKAAESIYSRFTTLCGGESSVLPEYVLSLSPQQLREIGVSGRKASYIHDLAIKYREGILSDSLILEMDDEELLTNLTMVKGIGVWSVHMFMIFSLHRPDVLPVGDLGVRKGVQKFYGLKELPKPLQMEQLCEKWRPYRSIGSWYMWRFMEAKGVLTATSMVTGN